MAGELDIQRLDSVFKSRPDIIADIRKAAGMIRLIHPTLSNYNLVVYLDRLTRVIIH